MSDKIEQLVNELYSKGFAIGEAFFNESSVSAFLNYFEQNQELLKDAGIGKSENFQKVKEIRSDKIVWIDENHSSLMNELFFKVLHDLILQLNRRCFLGLNTFEFHFAKYEPGTFYKRHRDAFSNDDARKISVVVYLNKNWMTGDGGELNIYADSDTICVEPRAGTIVIFESHIEHEVLKSNTNRYSITGWLKNERMKV